MQTFAHDRVPAIAFVLTFMLVTAGLSGFSAHSAANSGDTGPPGANVRELGSVDLPAGLIIVDHEGGGDYTTIQEGIDAALPGDTVQVWGGDYFEDIVVDRTISLTGNGTAATTINGSGTGSLVTISAPWVNFTGFTVQGGEEDHAGIFLETVHDVRVQDCEVRFCRDGLYLNVSSGNVLEDLSSLSNEDDGVVLVNSHSNALNNVTMSYNDLRGLSIEDSAGNNVTNSTCDGNGQYGVYMAGSDSNRLSYNTLTGNWYGAGIADSSGNSLDNNTVRYNFGGIRYMKLLDRIGPASMYSGTHAWWSGDDYGEQSTTLNFTVDLNSTTENATLKFWHWYDTDENYDGGRVEYLVGNGSEWEPLEPQGGYPGRTWEWPLPNTAYSGKSAGWVDATFDLPNASGSLTDLRFVFVGDTSINEAGWFIDDVSIDDISFFDDMESGPGGWTSAATKGTQWSLVSSVAAVDHTRIVNNTVTDNYYGLQMDSSPGALLARNDCSDNTVGAYLTSCHNITVEDNLFADCGHSGVYLIDTNSSFILSNTMTACGVMLEGEELYFWNNHTFDAGNTVNGLPLRYFRNATDITVTMASGQVILANCSRVSVEGVTLWNSTCGVLVGYSDNVTVKDCTLSFQRTSGAVAYNSTYLNFTDNYCPLNGESGLALEKCDIVGVDDNICPSNLDSGIYATEGAGQVGS